MKTIASSHLANAIALMMRSAIELGNVLATGCLLEVGRLSVQSTEIFVLKVDYLAAF